MKEDSSTNRKAGSHTNLPIDTDDFIRQVSFASSGESVSKSTQTDIQAEIQNETPEPTEEKPTKRKRGQTLDYESLFLSRNELRDRQGLYISRENYGILQTLVRAIRNERLSVSGLVDNIISQHIELYGDEINRIYDENSRKPIKKKEQKQ
ncbi:hypothetical protein FACS189411_09460 [Bacteroidia bacterium]|nr:hypothetical protein FACS189411_09460 [Bacteroidia bacterium]GHV10454.1 hypothetical protein FACS1894162_4620 [Bacteroidia bacterium]